LPTEAYQIEMAMHNKKTFYPPYLTEGLDSMSPEIKSSWSPKAEAFERS
jgi:hypothetical protein